MIILRATAFVVFLGMSICSPIHGSIEQRGSHDRTALAVANSAETTSVVSTNDALKKVLEDERIETHRTYEHPRKHTENTEKSTSQSYMEEELMDKLRGNIKDAIKNVVDIETHRSYTELRTQSGKRDQTSGLGSNDDEQILRDRIFKQTKNPEHTHCHSRQNGHVFFVDPTTPKPDILYFISTPWHLHYPKQLKKAVTRLGFQLVSRPTDRCRWLHQMSVQALGVMRGEIDVQSMGEWGTTLENDMEKQMAVERIREMMRTTYPWVEITTIVVMCFSPVWAWILYRFVWIRWRHLFPRIRSADQTGETRTKRESCEELVVIGKASPANR